MVLQKAIGKTNLLSTGPLATIAYTSLEVTQNICTETFKAFFHQMELRRTY